ncbi:hypothetical protein ACFLQ7_02690 [Actinomycetota bacterium]
MVVDVGAVEVDVVVGDGDEAGLEHPATARSNNAAVSSSARYRQRI